MAEDASLQLSRLAALATFIADNPGTPLLDVAFHFDRKPAQLRRDIAVLIDSGFDDLLPGRTLELDLEAYLSDQTLTLRSPLGLQRSAVLTADDLALLTYGLQAIAPMLTQTEAQAIPRVLEKIAAYSGLESAFDQTLVDTISTPLTSERLQLLRGAIAGGQRVRFHYVSGSGKRGVRTVAPTGLSFARDGWLLDSICLDAGAPRFFRLDRMDDLEVLPPDASSNADIASSGGHSQGQTVLVELSPDAGWLTHETAATSVRRSPRGLTAEFTMWDPHWMRTELLLTSRCVRRVDPAYLLEEARAYAEEALETWKTICPKESSEND